MILLFFWNFVKKELNLFYRTSGTILASIVFSLSLFSLFRFTLVGDNLPIHMILWVTHLLSTVFLLMQSQEWEKEEKAYRVFSLSGIDLNRVFMGKVVALIVVIFSLWIIETLVWFLFFDVSSLIVDFDQFFYLMVIIGVLSSFALAISGIQASALAVHADFSIVILFMIFLPLNMPVSIASSQLIMLSTEGRESENLVQLIFLILAFTMFYTASGILLFKKLIEE